MFGKNIHLFFPRARIRFIRYEGIEEKFGTEMNVIKDVIFEGTILKMIRDCIAYLDTQIKEKSVGMRLPEYYSNAFILQTVMRNTKAESQMLKFVNSLEKSVFDGQKLAIEKIKSLIDEKRYKEPTKRNIANIQF